MVPRKTPNPALVKSFSPDVNAISIIARLASNDLGRSEDGLRRSLTNDWRRTQDWAVAQLQDSLAVGVLWLIGLYILHVPLAPMWAVIAAVLQIVPHFGPILGLLGTRSRCSYPMDGLGASSGGASAVCHHCVARRTRAPAIHHEKNGQGAGLGIRSGADRAGSAVAILGSAGRRALAGSVLCIPSTRGKDSATGCAAKMTRVTGKLKERNGEIATQAVKGNRGKRKA